MSRAELWRVKTRRRANPPLDRMAWGKDHEHRAVHAVEVATGILYENTLGAQQRHKLEAGGYDLRCIPDGVYTHVLGRSGLEVKCPERLHEEPRPQLLCQVQFECFICDFVNVTLLEWTFGGHRAWHVEPSSEYINWAMPLLDEFMDYFYRDEEPPRLRKRPEPPEVTWHLMFEEIGDVPFKSHAESPPGGQIERVLLVPNADDDASYTGESGEELEDLIHPPEHEEDIPF